MTKRHSGTLSSSVLPQTNRLSLLRNRESTSVLYTIDLDMESDVEDAFFHLDRELHDLKQQISSQSKQNFVLERDVRYLDSKIALLIQNRMAQEEQHEFAKRLNDNYNAVKGSFPDDRKLQLYGALFFLLQSEPAYIASLVRRVKLSNMDALLQIVMFNIYGNQYESREEHLLLSLFQMVLTTEFEATSDVLSLLRANTPVSRMLTTYTRRGPGQAYLRSILYQCINDVAIHPDLQLDIHPLSVYRYLVNTGQLSPSEDDNLLTNEEVSEFPAVKNAIQERSAQLLLLTKRFLDAVLNSIDEIPYGIRWVCKLIRNLTNRLFPSISDSTICSLIGGFFFLRFVNPAIISPQTSMLLDSCPSDNVRKTLATIAKIIQSVANGTSSTKTHLDVSFQPMLKEYEEKVHNLLRKLGNVGDFFEALELDQYIALSKKSLALEMTVNEIYLTHEIILENLDNLYDPDSHVHLILQELGEPCKSVPQEDNCLVTLPLYNRWDSSIPDLKQNLKVTREDILYVDAKTLFIQLLRLLPSGHPATRVPLDLPLIADSVSSLKSMSLMKKGIRAIELLDELSTLRLVDKENRYEPLTSEVEKEFIDLDALYERIRAERDALQDVHRAICDHNEYLQTQLQIYGSYLNNARSQIKPSHSDSKGFSRGVGVVGIKPKNIKSSNTVKLSSQQLKKESVLLNCTIPEFNVSNTYFTFSSPSTDNFVIAVYQRGHSKVLVEVCICLDDVLQRRYASNPVVDLGFLTFEANKLYHLFEQLFLRK
ncbi:GTPase-activating protein [Schizosaccharomyces pombe]